MECGMFKAENTQTHTFSKTHTNTHTRTHTRTPPHTHTRTHARKHACTHACTQTMRHARCDPCIARCKSGMDSRNCAGKGRRPQLVLPSCHSLQQHIVGAAASWAGLAVLSGTVAAIHAIPRSEGGMDCGNRAGFSCVAIGSQPWSSYLDDMAEQCLDHGGTVAAICFVHCMSLWDSRLRGSRKVDWHRLRQPCRHWLRSFSCCRAFAAGKSLQRWCSHHGLSRLHWRHSGCSSVERTMMCLRTHTYHGHMHTRVQARAHAHA